MRDACLRVLQPGDVFYDIGGNAGLISVEIAKVLNGKVRVFAFEPQPALAHVMAVSGALNGFPDWSVFPVMLGSRRETATLFVPPSTYLASRVSRSPKAVEITCPVLTLDSMVAAQVIPPPRVIKIDVEGGELDVFRGARETLRAHRPYLIFESDTNMVRFGYSRRELLEFLRELGGYRFFGIQGSQFVPFESDAESETSEIRDVLAVPPGASVG